jgi:competence protein ComEC
MRRTTLLAVLLMAFVGGVGFAKLGWPISRWWLLVAVIFMVISLRRKQPLAILTVLVFGFTVGWWRGAIAQRQLQPYRDVYNQKVVFRATALTDAIYGDKGQFSFDVNHLSFIEPIEAEVPGAVTIKGFGESAVFRGDELQIEGKLQSTLGGKQGRMSFANFQIVGHHDTAVDNIRRRFSAGLISAVPEPMASFGLGLLIGQRNTLPAEVTKQLSTVGLSHVVAVSGYNLTIIVEVIRKLLGKRSKYQGTIMSLLLIVGFLLVTGLSASIVRAAVVSVLGLWAWYYGRAFKPLLLISLTATLTLMWNPLYVWGDIGWYLSFLAFFGVLVLCPYLIKRIYNSSKQPGPLMGIVLESLSAQIVTAPLILFIFNQASLVSLPSNVLIVPLVLLAMLVTFVAGLAGMLIGPVAGWFAWPARILLTYMLDAVKLLSRVPYAAVSRAFPLSYMIGSYALIIIICFVLWLKTRQNYAIVTETETEY